MEENLQEQVESCSINKKKHCSKCIIIMIVCCLISFFAGYYFGGKTMAKNIRPRISLTNSGLSSKAPKRSISQKKNQRPPVQRTQTNVPPAQVKSPMKNPTSALQKNTAKKNNQIKNNTTKSK